MIIQPISPPKPSSLSTDPMRDYLLEIGRVPLLEKSEEVIYGKRVQKMMSLLAEKEKLEKKLGVEPSLKKWAGAVGLSEDELNRVLRQGRLAKTKMIEANLRLVVSPSLTGSEADRQKIPKAQSRITRPHSRRQPRFGTSSREVRPLPRLSLFHLCILVDSSKDNQSDCG